MFTGAEWPAMSKAIDISQPKTPKEVQKSARKDRLARALKANIKRRKEAPGQTGETNDGRKD